MHHQLCCMKVGKTNDYEIQCKTNCLGYEHTWNMFKQLLHTHTHPNCKQSFQQPYKMLNLLTRHKYDHQLDFEPSSTTTNLNTRQKTLNISRSTSEVNGGVSSACPSPRKPGNRFRFCLFVRAVRAGEAMLCGRVTDAASDAGAGSWKLCSCSAALARAQMLLCAWVLSRCGLYVWFLLSCLHALRVGFMGPLLTITAICMLFLRRALKTRANTSQN